MSDELDQWQWLDEDPIEKLLHGPKGVVKAESPATLFTAPETSHTDDPADTTQSSLAALIDEACAQLEQGLNAEAVASFAALVEAAPDYAGSHFGLGVALERMEDWDSAGKAFERCLEIDPDRIAARISLGACLLHLDNAKDALTCFEKCALAGPEQERVMLGIAVALQKLKRYEEADWAYRELLQLNPKSVEALGNVIALSVARHDAGMVAEYSKRLIELDPQSKTALQGLVTSAMWEADYAAAIGYCTRLLDTDAMSFAVWSNLGFAKQRLGQPEKSMRSIA